MKFIVEVHRYLEVEVEVDPELGAEEIEIEEIEIEIEDLVERGLLGLDSRVRVVADDSVVYECYQEALC